MGEFMVVLVDSTSQALRIEKLLLKQGQVCKLIPVPRHLSSDCGVCVRVEGCEKEGIANLLMDGRIDFQAIEEI